MNNRSFVQKVACCCPLIVISLLSMTLILTLFNEVQARICFYLAFYFTLAGLLSERIDGKAVYSLAGKGIYLAFLLLGLSKLLWFGWEYIGVYHENRYNSYLVCGKRLLLSAVMAWYLMNRLEHFSARVLPLLNGAFITALLVASGVGMWQIAHHVERVDFYVGRATDAAYMYAGLSTVVITLLLAKRASKKGTIYALFLLPVAYFILMSTATRNTMVTFPLTLFMALAITSRHLSRRLVLGLFGLIGLFILLTWQPFVKPGINRTVNEYHIFQNSNGNHFSSLSSRLSMWRVGVRSFLAHPWGASERVREQWSNDYVKQTHKDGSALEFMRIHLHNEWIESASLQGIQGLITLGVFYLLLFYRAIVWRDAKLLSLLLIMLLSGLTDVIFISREQTIFFATFITLCAVYHLKRVQLAAKCRQKVVQC